MAMSIDAYNAEMKSFEFDVSRFRCSVGAIRFRLETSSNDNVNSQKEIVRLTKLYVAILAFQKEGNNHVSEQSKLKEELCTIG